MCIWKVSVGLKCAHAKNGFLLKSFALIYVCIQKVISVSEISVVNFMVVLNQLMLEKRRKMKFHNLKQIIHESLIPQAINHSHMHFRYSRITFLFCNFHTSRTNFSTHHTSCINPLPPPSWLKAIRYNIHPFSDCPHNLVLSCYQASKFAQHH